MKTTPIGFLLLALACGSGCAGLHHEVHSPIGDGCQRGVIFTADGAGGFLATSKALTHELQTTCLQLGVVSVDWSHGYGRVFADQVDWRHSREEGCKLAGQILAYRQSFPQGKVYMVAHSAGTAVAIAAAESLPPGSIDRIVLLAPSMATDYDLRPALSSVRESIEVFYSSRDKFHLGFGVAILGTADGCHGCTAAGRTAFQPQIQSPADAALYAKLRQHPWDPCLAWTGNHGGHYGDYQPEFLRAFVLPLLAN
jgi:pimeloyl-ACP methyl ester carboxylesterase